MKKQTKDLKNRTIKDLEKEAGDLRKEITKLKLEVKINPKKDVNLITKKRKRLAVLLTMLTEKEFEESIKVKNSAKL